MSRIQYTLIQDRVTEYIPVIEKYLPLVLEHAKTHVTPSDIKWMLEADEMKLVVFTRTSDPRMVGFGIIGRMSQPSGDNWLVDAHVWVLEQHRRERIFSGYQNWLTEYAIRSGCKGIVAGTVHEQKKWSTIMPKFGFKPRLTIWEREV